MHIAVLRGGKYRVLESTKSAENIVRDLGAHLRSSDPFKTKKVTKVLDVHIDENNNWTALGLTTTAHSIFSNTDIVIDTTHRNREIKNKDEKLAHRMGIRGINGQYLNREENILHLRAILKQLDVRVPKYAIVRSTIENRLGSKHLRMLGDNVEDKLHDLWRTHHLPIIIKSANRKSYTVETYNPVEALNHIKSIHKTGDHAVVDEKVNGRDYALIAIKDFRGEKVYITTIFENLNLDNKNIFNKSYRRALSLSEKDKEELRDMIKSVHSHTNLRYARYDIVKNKHGFYITHISAQPSYATGSFMHTAFESNGISFAELL